MIQIKIAGMTCGSCVKSLEACFAKQAKVTKVTIDLANKLGTFEGDLSAEEIIELVEDQGFDAQSV